MRILIGGVGYRNLRDHSFGVVLVDALAVRKWPDGVVVEDVSYNPIAVVQQLQEVPVGERFDLVILAGVLQRPGRKAGTLAVYRWDNVLPSPELIHDSVTEAVTGIIAFDNTLIVGRYFNVWPTIVVAVELEPGAQGSGDELTRSAERALGRASARVANLIADPSAAERLPVGSLEFDRVRHTGVVFEQVMRGHARLH